MTNNQIDITSVSDSKIAKYSSDNIKKSLRLARKLSNLDRDTEKDAEDYFILGTEKLNSEDYQESIDYFNIVVVINPLYIEAYLNRAIAKKELKDYQGTIDDCNQTIKLNPNHAIAYCWRARAKYNLKDYKSAIDDFTQTIKLDPNTSRLSPNQVN